MILDIERLDEGLTARVGALNIAREATVTRDPGIGAFHYPSPLEHMKAWGHNLVPVHLHAFFHPDRAQAGPRMLDDLQTHPEVVRDPLLEGLKSIAALPPDHLETRQLSSKRLEQDLAPWRVSAISREHFDAEQQPLRVDQQMPFAALNFF